MEILKKMIDSSESDIITNQKNVSSILEIELNNTLNLNTLVEISKEFEGNSQFNLNVQSIVADTIWSNIHSEIDELGNNFDIVTEWYLKNINYNNYIYFLPVMNLCHNSKSFNSLLDINNLNKSLEYKEILTAFEVDNIIAYYVSKNFAFGWQFVLTQNHILKLYKKINTIKPVNIIELSCFIIILSYYYSDTNNQYCISAYNKIKEFINEK
jgi:hypothetical protein